MDLGSLCVMKAAGHAEGPQGQNTSAQELERNKHGAFLFCLVSFMCTHLCVHVSGALVCMQLQVRIHEDVHMATEARDQAQMSFLRSHPPC